jgi:predicted nucleotidyltransferase
VQLTEGVVIADDLIADFCRNWRITELAVFGSAARGDFRADSDVDVLVTFDHDAPWSLLEFVEMKEELKTIIGREVDLVERAAVEESKNPFRKRSILRDARVIYRVGAADPVVS